MGARRELTAALVERYRSAGRADNGRILDELCAVTGWHRKHAVRVLASDVAISPEARRQRRPTYGAPIRDALVALWEASDRICGKRLRIMIPTLLPSLERHGRLKLDQAEGPTDDIRCMGRKRRQLRRPLLVLSRGFDLDPQAGAFQYGVAQLVP